MLIEEHIVGLNVGVDDVVGVDEGYSLRSFVHHCRRCTNWDIDIGVQDDTPIILLDRRADHAKQTFMSRKTAEDLCFAPQLARLARLPSSLARTGLGMGEFFHAIAGRLEFDDARVAET
ncbi:hypothetical protein ACRE_024870 [Hapsidospora chrysogenum ATCC 11550]|uniref:Uncharacterized protein n=1 Tax=Hapsidospora chrysogenum (strain ATCC 11550 / CBS 779.69 / DSM 880 / IAM 14645 / JCM 23072 / IMI 49137) TaxID=857340 RepID=A0A086TB60_HAPC1|nr:hypothetical protein ACRE_024870 [Hapsidospora chrysogenum ATCC 11550]